MCGLPVISCAFSVVCFQYKKMRNIPQFVSLPFLESSFRQYISRYTSFSLLKSVIHISTYPFISWSSRNEKYSSVRARTKKLMTKKLISSSLQAQIMNARSWNFFLFPFLKVLLTIRQAIPRLGIREGLVCSSKFREGYYISCMPFTLSGMSTVINFMTIWLPGSTNSRSAHYISSNKYRAVVQKEGPNCQLLLLMAMRGDFFFFFFWEAERPQV